MVIYIAMLRGINVSGHHIIKMERLRAAFTMLGFLGVRTYVQSGNVIFQAPKDSSARLSERIGEKILRDFAFAVSVLLRTSREMAQIVDRNPFSKERAIDHSRLHIAFLSASPSKAALRNLRALAVGPDRFCLTGQELHLYCPNGYGRSALANSAVERLLSVRATTRNWKTVTRLCEMAARAFATPDAGRSLPVKGIERTGRALEA